MTHAIPLLLLSVLLSAGRNLLTKKTATAGVNPAFFFSQGILFLSGAALLLVCKPDAFIRLAPLTLLLGCAYSILLISAQWMYTLALRTGDASICSVVYSMGFILPTLSGALFWREAFHLIEGIGLLLAVILIWLTAGKSPTRPQKAEYVPYLLAAMVSSGGLGILQKVQQSTPSAPQRDAFLLIAFLLASGCSFAVHFWRRHPAKSCKENVLYPALVGVCFGGANLCNTILSGRMRSAVFFPLQNVSTILITVIAGVVFFREKINRRTATIILLGIATVLLFSI